MLIYDDRRGVEQYDEYDDDGRTVAIAATTHF